MSHFNNKAHTPARGHSVVIQNGQDKNQSGFVQLTIAWIEMHHVMTLSQDKMHAASWLP